MFKKMDKDNYKKFWEEFSTSIKLGVIEDPSNKTRLAKLLRYHYTQFQSTWSHSIPLGPIPFHMVPIHQSILCHHSIPSTIQYSVSIPFHRFQSSNDSSELTSLEEYIERMKEKQEHIYFVAGQSREDVGSSPFVERLLKKGYEVLYLTDPVDEYCLQNLPEFEGKKFQVI